VASAWASCETVGGDLYDVTPLPGDRLALMVADVAGHGVAAALLVGMVKTAVERGMNECVVGDRIDLAPAARAVLETLAPLNKNRVLTLFLAVVDAPAGTLHYLNAGHPPAVLWRPGSEPRELGATTPLLSFGIGMAPKPSASVPFAPGDRLAIFSDGLYELRDPEGGEYGRERLMKALTAKRGSIEKVVDEVIQETRRHSGGRPPEDDVTLLVAEALTRRPA